MRTPLRRRWVLSAVALVVVGGGSAGAWALSRSGSAAATTSAAPALVAASVGTLVQTVSTSGTLQPAQQQALSFQVSGTVTGVAATVGSAVGKGAVLATVDATGLRSAQTSAAAAVTAAEQQLAALSSPTAAQLSAAQAALAQSRSALTQAQSDLAAASLTAPFAGTVATVSMAVGDVVASNTARSSGANAGAGGGGASSGQASSSSESITLISTNAWQVVAAVGSADLAQLRKGEQAVITPSGSRTPVFGTVSTIGIVASATSGGTAAFPVVIDVTGNPPGLYAGGSVTVAVTVHQLNDVLIVPTAAVQQANGQTIVYAHVAGKRVAMPVTVGQSVGPQTEVVKGLTAGTEVEVQGGRVAGRTGGARTPGVGGGGFGGGTGRGGLGGGGFGGNG